MGRRYVRWPRLRRGDVAAWPRGRLRKDAAAHDTALIVYSSEGVAGRRAFLLGAGGAGAAIAAALAKAGIGELILQDIDAAKRDAVMARLARAYPAIPIDAGDLTATGFDIAINATPLGMKTADPLPFDPEQMPPSTLIVDVITKPDMTPLLRRATASGHQVQTGRHMHEAQALEIGRFLGIA